MRGEGFVLGCEGNEALLRGGAGGEGRPCVLEEGRGLFEGFGEGVFFGDGPLEGEAGIGEGGVGGLELGFEGDDGVAEGFVAGGEAGVGGDEGVEFFDVGADAGDEDGFRLGLLVVQKVGDGEGLLRGTRGFRVGGARPDGRIRWVRWRGSDGGC